MKITIHKIRLQNEEIKCKKKQTQNNPWDTYAFKNIF